MKKNNLLLVLFAIGYLPFAVVTAQTYTGNLPPPVIKEAQRSIFSQVPSIVNKTKLIKEVFIFSKPPPSAPPFFREEKPLSQPTPELKVLVFPSPLSFFINEKSVILISKLIGFDGTKPNSMSVFCFNKVIYEGVFAQQIVLNLNLLSNINRNVAQPCTAVIEYDNKNKTIETIETVKREFALPSRFWL